MRPSILLIGKNGQVGAELASFLPEIGEVLALGRAELDLTNANEIRRIIRDLAPRVIVNTAAYTAVDRAESEAARAQAVNAEAPAVMAEEARKLRALLVHYSTDYIFDGRNTSPYRETDPPNPVNAYGRTKLEGEQAIRRYGVDHLIFRTAWVYATRGRNFLLTILRLATQREELRIVHDQIGAPTWSREIASATAKALEQMCNRTDRAAAWSERNGTYHMTAGGETNWHEFTEAI